MAELHTIEGPHAGGMFVLDRESAILGRHPDCDIVLDSGAVSRQHARIQRIDDKIYIEDMQSRNGTYVNGRQIRERQLLKDQDRITLCDVVMEFIDNTVRKGGGRGTVSNFGSTVLMVEDDAGGGNTNVMTRLDVSAGSSSLSLEVNPQAKLKALIEISQKLGRAVGLTEVLPKVLDSLLTIFPRADRGVMVLRDPATGKLIPRALKHRRPELVETVRISRTIVQGVMASKEAILSADASSDDRFKSSESIVDFHIRSVMCAPLIDSQGEVTGVIQIDTSDQRNRFSRDDLEVLASVACQAAFAVENAQLHEMAIRDQKRTHELEVAHDVLRGFLPSSVPRIEGYDFFDFYEPANELGGDYYDYIPLPGKRLAVVVADVSGKGIPASLLMARLSADVRYCLASEPSPAAAVAQLNRVFFSAGWEDRFVTLVLAVLDPLRHEITLVDAGHPPSYLNHKGQVVQAVDEAHSSVPLGVIENADYGQVTHHLEPGDQLVLYTDGISEAMNEADELYGFQRLYEQVAVPCRGAAAHGQNILANVKAFVGKQSQSDDMCLVCLGREG